MSRASYSRSPNKVNYVENSLAHEKRKDVEKIIEKTCLANHDNQSLKTILIQEVAKCLQQTVAVAVV